MKTSELTRDALDWAVSAIVENSRKFPIWIDGKPQSYAAYSTDWAKGGPIIEREKITLDEHGDGWLATRVEGHAVCTEFGSTMLVAAMRCYVVSRLGDEIDIPEGEMK